MYKIPWELEGRISYAACLQEVYNSVGVKKVCIWIEYRQVKPSGLCTHVYLLLS